MSLKGRFPFMLVTQGDIYKRQGDSEPGGYPGLSGGDHGDGVPLISYIRLTLSYPRSDSFKD